MKQAEVGKKAESAGPSYCPAFSWRKALALAQETSDIEPGAHRRKLTVAFNAAQSEQRLRIRRLQLKTLGGRLYLKIHPDGVGRVGGR